MNGTPSSAVTLSTNNIELKLLRVLQTLFSLRDESHGKKRELTKFQKQAKNLLLFSRVSTLMHSGNSLTHASASFLC